MKLLFKLFEKIGRRDAGICELGETKNNYEFLRQCSKEFSNWIVIAFVISLLGGIFQVITFDFLGELVDWLNSATATSLFDDRGGDLVVIAIAITLVIPLLTLFKNLIFHQLLAPNLQQNSIVKLYRALIGAPASYHEEDDPGATAIVIVDTSEAVIDVILQFCGFAGFLIAFLGALLFYVGNINGWLTIPFIIWTGLFVGMLIWQWVPKAKTTNRLEAESCAEITGKFTERFARIRTVKMLSDEGHEQAFVQRWASRHRRVVEKEFQVFSHFASVIALLNGLLMVGAGVLCLILWMESRISLGELSMVLALVYRVTSLSEWCQEEFDSFFVAWGQVTIGRELVNEFLDDVELPEGEYFKVSEGKIVFQGVEFGYPGKPILFSDFSLEINAGEKVGIIGPSGAGKSSLLNMLSGIDEIEDGLITIDGQDISSYSTDKVCRELSFLNQDIGLFNQSIYQNIVFGLGRVNRRAVDKALAEANADIFVVQHQDSRSRKGLSAWVGENGSLLSGGQRQRLAMARALLRDKKILLLDEATSALDPSLKQEFLLSLNGFMQGKTVISIAHSYDVLSMMDRIIEINEGKIIREGKPADILN